jgi:putative PEP-CTERM system TPR-repeat lipoprotein
MRAHLIAAGKFLAPAIFLAIASQAVIAADSKAARYYEDALGRFDKQDLAGATIQLKNALQIDQNMLAAHVLLGKVLLSNGDPVGAEVEFDASLRLGVSREEVLGLLGQAYLKQGKYRELLERVTPGGLPTAAQADVLILRANAESESGHPNTALKTLDEARSLDPRSVSVRLTQAAIYIRTGDLSRAATVADEAIALAPNDAKAWNTRASVLHLKNDLPGALSAYSKAAELNPKYLDPRVTRAGLLLDTGSVDDAAREVDGILAIEPRDPRANYLRAVIAARRGDQATVKASLGKVVQLLDPVDPAVLALNRQMLLLAGLAHFELGDQEKAFEKLSAYLRRYPGEPGPSKLMASLLLDRGDHRAALSLLEPLQRAMPNDPRLLALLAAAYMKDRNFRKASELLDQAVRTSGGAPDIRTDYGLSLLGAGEAESGLDQLRRAFDKDPKQMRAGIALTTLYLRKGDPKRALDVIQKVVAGDPGNLAALNLLGIVQVSAGDRAGGRKTYQRVLARDAGYQAAILNLARLDAAEGNADLARQRLAKFVKGDARNVDAMLELATLEERAGNVAEAIRWLEKARVEPSGALRAGVALIEVHLRHGSPEIALAVAKETALKAPENLAVLELLARTELATGDSKKALQTLKEMTRFANYDAASQFNIARLQLAAGSDSDAAYSLDKALSAKPDFLPALALYAEIEIRRKDFAKAEQRIKAVGDKSPASGLAARLQGDLALVRGQYAAALAAYGAALKKDDSTDMALRLFRAYVDGRELAKGVAFLEKWYRDHPNQPVVLRTIADGQLRLGHLGEARTAYERLLKGQPDDALILNNLAQVALRQNDKSAAALAERAYALRPADPVVEDTLGWILVRQDQLDRGIGLLRDARLRDPANAEIRYHLAVGLHKSGRKAEARDELRQALKSGSSFDGIEDARKLDNELGR